MYYVGPCRFCAGNGSARVLRCGSGEHLLAQCDECLATWTDPELDSPHSFADVADPRCPICQASLKVPPACWPERAELVGVGWVIT